MNEDIQQRIRGLAYLMWESGGKQADMANEYWLRAEREVMATVQKAAKIVSPAKKPAAKKAEPAAPTPAPAAPAAAAPKPAAPAPAASAPAASKPAEPPKPEAKKAAPVLAKKIPTSSS